MLDSLLFPLLSYLIPHSIDFIPSKVPGIDFPFHFPSHQPLQVIISHMNYFSGLLTDLSTYFQPLHTLSNIHKRAARIYPLQLAHWETQSAFLLFQIQSP